MCAKPLACPVQGRSCLGPGVSRVPWLILGTDPESPRTLSVTDVARLRFTVRTGEDTPLHSW